MSDDVERREEISRGDDAGDAGDDAGTSSPPRPRRKAGNPLRVVLLITLVAAALLAGWYARVYARRAALLRMQQACLDYNPPAETVVYEENPEHAWELLGRGGAGEYVPIPAGGSGGAGAPPIAGHVPSVWREMKRWAMPAGGNGPQAAVLFLHERRTPAGQRLLVCVEADRANRRLRITFIHPGASTLDPTPVPDVDLAPAPKEGLIILSSGGDPFAAKLPPPPPEGAVNDRSNLRFLTGQAASNDATRFSLPYRLNGQAGELDMWVADERTVYYVDRRFAHE